jgi:predicted XRE-type DNA-binding protein
LRKQKSNIKLAKRDSSTPIEVGSGNVFADLGLPNPEEALAKAEIARLIARSIRERGLNQLEAAKVLGIRQPRVSALTRGRLAPFSLEKLLEFARKLGLDVEISVRRSAEPHLKVLTA